MKWKNFKRWHLLYYAFVLLAIVAISILIIGVGAIKSLLIGLITGGLISSSYYFGKSKAYDEYYDKFQKLTKGIRRLMESYKRDQ